MMESRHAQRKNEHLSLAAKYYDQVHQHHYFDQVRLIHDSLPEMTTDDVDLHVQLADNLEIECPFYIEAMTGGSDQALKINQQLAQLAHKHHLAMATGSLSIISKDPQSFSSFEIIREENPDGIIFANLSANASLDQAINAISLLKANALELLAAQIGAQGEDVLGRVLVHRGVGRGAHHDDGVRRVADHEHEHAQQRGVHQALTHNVLPVFLVEHQGRQTADNQDADDDGHQAVAHEEGDTQQRYRQHIEHVGQYAAGCGGGPDGGEHHGDEQQDIDDEAGVEAKAQHVDKEQFKPTAHLHDAGHDAIEHGYDEQHGHAEGGQRTFGVGLRLLVVVIDQDDGRQAQQVEQVHADGQTGEVEDKHQIAVGVGLVGMLFPLEDEPEYQRGKHRRIGIHLTLDGREPERVAPRIGQGARHAGGDDRHHLPQALHLAAGTHQLARQVRYAPEEEQDAEGREQRRHDVDTVGHVGRVVSKLCEEVGRQHEEGCAGRVSHFQFVARGDKLGAVPEARGGLGEVLRRTSATVYQAADWRPVFPARQRRPALSYGNCRNSQR